MRVRLRFFASLREQLGVRGEWTIAAGTTVGSLWRAVVADRPALRDVPVRFAVNEAYVEGTHRLSDGDEVAFFPPVSGGG